jgi:hypothetical protein
MITETLRHTTTTATATATTATTTTTADKIATWIDYKVAHDTTITQLPYGMRPLEAPFLLRPHHTTPTSHHDHLHHTNITHAQLMEAIIVMHYDKHWPELDEVATNFAFYLAGAGVSYDIFACSHPWTAAILQKAAPPGAWLADALHTAMISFWLPGQENKQHWVKNQHYTALYDHINEALLHYGQINQEHYAAHEQRSSNNKGNSMELLAIHLWDQGEHLLLLTMILTIIALNESTRDWAPVGFPDFA